MSRTLHSCPCGLSVKPIHHFTANLIETMQFSSASTDSQNVRALCDHALFLINLARSSRNLQEVVYNRSLSICARLRSEQVMGQVEAEHRKTARIALPELLEKAGYPGSSVPSLRIKGPGTMNSLIQHLLKPSDHRDLFNPAHSDFGLYVSKSSDGRLEWIAIMGARKVSKTVLNAVVQANKKTVVRKRMIGDSSYKNATKPAIKHLSVIRKEVLRLINVERDKRGHPLLILNGLLNHCALVHTKDQISMNKMTHMGSDGRTPARRVEKIGHPVKRVGENIAVGHSTGGDFMKAWMESPLHKHNILNGTFTILGLHVEDNIDGRRFWFWTQVFAAPLSK